MIKIVKVDGHASCNGCDRSTYKRENDKEQIEHVHEVSIGYRHQFLTSRLCDYCLKELIAECVIAVTPKPKQLKIEKCNGCGELREESWFQPESREDVTCQRCGGTFHPYTGEIVI